MATQYTGKTYIKTNLKPQYYFADFVNEAAKLSIRCNDFFVYKKGLVEIPSYILRQDIKDWRVDVHTEQQMNVAHFYIVINDGLVSCSYKTTSTPNQYEN